MHLIISAENIIEVDITYFESTDNGFSYNDAEGQHDLPAGSKFRIVSK